MPLLGYEAYLAAAAVRGGSMETSSAADASSAASSAADASSAQSASAPDGSYQLKMVLDRAMLGQSEEELAHFPWNPQCAYGIAKYGSALAFAMGRSLCFGAWWTTACRFDASNELQRNIERYVEVGGGQIVIEDVSLLQAGARIAISTHEQLLKIIDVLALTLHARTGGMPLPLSAKRLTMEHIQEKRALVTLGSVIKVVPQEKSTSDVLPSFDVWHPRALVELAAEQERSHWRAIGAMIAVRAMKDRTPLEFRGSKASKFAKMNEGTPRDDPVRVKRIVWSLAFTGASVLMRTIDHSAFPPDAREALLPKVDALLAFAGERETIRGAIAHHFDPEMLKLMPRTWDVPPVDDALLEKLVRTTSAGFRGIGDLPTPQHLIDSYKQQVEDDRVAGGGVSDKQLEMRARLQTYAIHFGNGSMLDAIGETRTLGAVYLCEVCNVSVTTKGGLQAHYNTNTHRVRAAGAGVPAETQTLYPCEVCNVSFTTKTNLKGHRKGKKHLKRAVVAAGAPEKPAKRQKGMDASGSGGGCK